MDSTENLYPELDLLIDGEWLTAQGRETIPVVNPATGKEIATLPCATPVEIDRAVAAAARAAPGWRDTRPAERAATLHRAAQLLRDQLGPASTNLTLEEGKVLAEAREEIEFSAGILNFFAEEGQRVHGKVVSPAPGRVNMVLVYEPYGPIAAFTPWNYPATVPARKVAAALAAGCTVVIKPAEETPASALAVARALVDAGLPDGVLNMVFGAPADISERVISSPLIRKVSFTGSTAIGRLIARAASAGVKPCMLELGGHAPVIVCEDADLEKAAKSIVSGKFHNSGQSCGSPSRMYVHESLYAHFCERFAELTSQLRTGDGLEPGIDIGPLASEGRVAAMERLVSDAVDHDARIMLGGSRIERDGFFFEPTVLVDVPEPSLIMNEEPFGPVAAIAPFSTLDDALKRANRLPFGLSSAVYTESLQTATTVSRALEAGMVGVNGRGIGGDVDTYFGGVKQSGYGSDGGTEALHEYLSVKIINQG
jgi:succinate-semialdehyde dehydrogenase / glutarate-semialdehyde dehydrogenase